MGGPKLHASLADAATPAETALGLIFKLLIVAAPFEPMELSVLPLIMGSRVVAGWNSGHAKDSEETLAFSALTGVRPKVEVYPLAKVEEAYARMLSNKARFRVVLKIGG